MIFYLLHKHQWIPNLFKFWCEWRYFLCNHSNVDIFTCENNMLFSCLKISRFHVKAHLVFHCCLYNKNCGLWAAVRKCKALWISQTLIKGNRVSGNKNAFVQEVRHLCIPLPPDKVFFNFYHFLTTFWWLAFQMTITIQCKNY